MARPDRKEHDLITLFALGLVVAAGFLHATWNLLAKRAGSEASGPAFVWLYSALSTAIFAPLAVSVVLEGAHRVLPLLARRLSGRGSFGCLPSGSRHGSPARERGRDRPLWGTPRSGRCGGHPPDRLRGIPAGVGAQRHSRFHRTQAAGDSLRLVDRRLYCRLHPVGQVRRERPLALTNPLLLGLSAGGDRRALAGGVAEEGGDRRRLAYPPKGGVGRGGLKSSRLRAGAHSALVCPGEPRRPYPGDQHPRRYPHGRKPAGGGRPEAASVCLLVYGLGHRGPGSRLGRPPPQSAAVATHQRNPKGGRTPRNEHQGVGLLTATPRRLAGELATEDNCYRRLKKALSLS